VTGTEPLAPVPGQLGGLLPRGTRVEVFESIYEVFLVLGTLVGVVVVGYMLYNAYKYREDGSEVTPEEDRPTLGELPEGGGKGRKLALSFALSAIIVISLVLWTYAMLLYVESGTPANAQAAVQDGGQPATTDGGQAAQSDPVTVRVEGFRFGWRFVYPNGHESSTLRVPADRRVWLNVTATDVFHNFGIPAFTVKTDAIPGMTTRTWFIAEETGTYTAKCYELCGAGHSYMTAPVEVVPPAEYETWYANTTAANGTEASETEATAAVRPEVTP